MSNDILAEELFLHNKMGHITLRENAHLPNIDYLYLKAGNKMQRSENQEMLAKNGPPVPEESDDADGDDEQGGGGARGAGDNHDGDDDDISDTHDDLGRWSSRWSSQYGDEFDDDDDDDFVSADEAQSADGDGLDVGSGESYGDSGSGEILHVPAAYSEDGHDCDRGENDRGTTDHQDWATDRASPAEGW